MVQGQPTRPQKTQSITSKVRERQQRMAGVGGKHSWIVQEWCHFLFPKAFWRSTAWTFEAQGRGCWPRGAPGRGSWCWGAEGTEHGHTPVLEKNMHVDDFCSLGHWDLFPSLYSYNYTCVFADGFVPMFITACSSTTQPWGTPKAIGILKGGVAVNHRCSARACLPYFLQLVLVDQDLR